MKYRREIDGLRALAVVPVILFHAGFETFSGGFVGVDVFFVISGYLITTIILSELEQGSFSIGNFYERRTRRIIPMLFLVMLCCIPFAWFWLLPGDMIDFSQSLVAVSFFASNILFWRESGYFDTAAELKPLLHTWSLAVEEQFYVIFPLFLMMFWRLGKRNILLLLCIAFVVSLTLAQWGAYAEPSAAFLLLPTRGWELLIGAFAAFYMSKAIRKDFGKGLSEVGGWLGLALIMYAILVYTKDTPFPGFYALAPTLGTVLIILFATQETTVGKFLGNKVFVGVGLISYSAYLWHQPLFAFVRHRGLAETHFEFLLLSIFSLILAYFSWRFVEVPFRQKAIFSRTKLFLLAFIFSSLFILFGYHGQNKNGFEDRFEQVLDGDVGNADFFQYIDEKYLDCEPNIVAEKALSWEGILRCKQSKKGTPDIVLLGDSHAEHLFLGLAEYVPNKNVGFYILAGKPYIENPEFKAIFEELLSNRKSQNILLTFHYFSRLDGQGKGLYEGFSSTIKSLVAAGNIVTLVGDVPRFNQNPGYCMYEMPSKSASSCVLSMDDVDRQKKVYDAILTRLSDEFSLRYLSIGGPLCTKESCAMTNDEAVLYRNNNHLNIIGSKIVGSYLADKLDL